MIRLNIRNSVVAKLWITIIATFIVVLSLLSIFLEQLFDNYFLKAEQDQLQQHMQHMAEIFTNSNYTEQTAMVVIYELAKAEGAEPLLIRPPDSENVIAKLTPAELAELVQGNTVIEQGKSARWSAELAQLVQAANVNNPSKTTGFAATSKVESLWVLEPLIEHGQVVALLSVVQPITAQEAVNKVRELLFFSAGLGIILATGLAFVVSKNLSNPLVQMNKVAEQMAQGDFHGKVQVGTNDEVGRLGWTLNTLAYKLEENIDDLEREKEQLASIITSMTDGVIAADLNGAISLANPPARRYIRAQLMAESRHSPDMALPKDLYDLEQHVMRHRESVTDELDWQGRILIITMVPLYEKDGETLRGVVAVLRDITDQRTLEKMRQDFIANVSHELRTPLAMMQGYSEALLDEFGDDPEQRRELTGIILDETHRMRRLVNDLLDLAQLESGQFQMNKESLEMEHLVRRVGRKFITLSNERDVALRVDVDEASRPFGVFGDSDRLEQVFTNLVDNAFRHTPKGGQIAIALLAEDSYVRVGVRDTGEGIPAEDLPFIWERFYKVDKARTRSKGGTGLGLAITKNIVQGHGGDIVVESERGVGTQFIVLLPRTEEEETVSV